MINLKVLLGCMFGPRVHSFYKFIGNTTAYTTPEVLKRSHRYYQNSMESTSDYVIRISKIFTSFGAYVSPILFTYLVYKYNDPNSLISSLDRTLLLKLFSTTIIAFFGSFCLRGFARYNNPEYLAFLAVLEEARNNPSVSSKRLLSHFDADFSAFPVDFKWAQVKDKRAPAPYKKTLPDYGEEAPLILDNNPLKYPFQFVTTLIMKTVGRRLVYPGSLGFLQALMQKAIDEGRKRLIEDWYGMRYKLEAYDGNHIDTMFVDRRDTTPNGEYLVIGCEGNGGFYELGTILTPLEAGYSVLGWNHPGFGGSTGIPYPDQDVAAVDIVIKFAMDKLCFAPSQIVIHGWSIGGFAATWAGMRFPNLHGLVVDASFDHILPLARNVFPGFLYPLIEMSIRQHFDLDNSRHLKHYQGPVLLVRRSQDEVIATDPYNSPATNRANYLLIDLLKQRFPILINERAVSLLHEFLAGDSLHQDTVLRRYSVNNNQCLKIIFDYLRTVTAKYPINIGSELDNTTRDRLVLFLASKHLIDYDSVHCAPLPWTHFRRPWNLLGKAQSNSML